jgi:hypothetical protein
LRSDALVLKFFVSSDSSPLLTISIISCAVAFITISFFTGG